MYCIKKLILGSRIDYHKPFLQQIAIVCVRGCEVEGMLDNMGRVIEEGPDPRPVLPGQKRTYRVWLDCNQYRADLDDVAAGKIVNKNIFIIIYKFYKYFCFRMFMKHSMY